MKITKYLVYIYIFLGLSASQSVFSQEIKVINNFFEAARAADKEGDFRRSADLCIQGLKKTPYDIDLKQQLGKSYMQMQMMDSARYFLHKVVTQDDNNVAARHYLVNVEFQTKRYSSAICYVNELLEKTPYWKGLWLKKISIYKEMGNFEEVKRAATRLRQIFPNDSVVQKNYNYIMSQEGLKVAKSGNIEQAKKTYLKILKQSPDNKDAYLNLINLETNAGRLESALEYADRALIYYPNEFDFIKKKIGTLETLTRYDAAISFLKSKRNEVPGGFYNTTEKYLIHEAARFYENTDPYVLHQKSYSLDSNKDSYKYLLNKSIDKGHYNESLRLIDQGLKKAPSSKDLLVKQMFVYKKQNDVSKYRNSVISLIEKYPGDYDIKQEYAGVLLSEAKEYTAQKQYQAALDNYFKLLNYPDYNAIANSNIFAIYTLQNNTQDALAQIDKMVQNEPQEKINLVKKAELLKDIQDYEGALEIVDSLIREFPEEEKYKKQYIYYSELYLKQLLEEQQFYKAFPIADKSLEMNRVNSLTYSYAINASAAVKNYNKMLTYADSAVYNHPKNLDFKLKRIGAYTLMNDYDRSTALLEELNKEYPNDSKVRGALVEERFKLATIAEAEDDNIKANTLYNSILLLDSLNIPTYQRLVNLSIKEQDTASAMQHINTALEIQPNSEERFFLYKKGVVYEMMEDYQMAYYYQKQSQKKKELDLSDHLDYLLHNQLKNQIGVSYLRVYSGEESFVTALAGIYYIRKLEKNSYGAYFDYASRTAGVGVQLHGQWVHKFSKTFYTQLDGYVGTKWFPKFKISGTAYKSFDKGWAAQLGLGYTVLQDPLPLTENQINVGFQPGPRSFFNLNAGVSKELNDFWLNGKVNLLFAENGQLYNNIFAQARYNANENGDYFVAMASAGNAPQEDNVVNFQINAFTTYTNSMVGAGYRWNHKHKFTYGIQGNWYSFLVPSIGVDESSNLTQISSRVDQYHLFFVIQTKF